VEQSCCLARRFARTAATRRAAARLLNAEQAAGALADARRELGEMGAVPLLALLPDEV
jgi:hypothetical protein